MEPTLDVPKPSLTDSQMVGVRAHPAPWWNAVELLVRVGHPRFGPVQFLRPDGSFVQPDPGTAVDASLRLERDAAQVLMDDLWASGIRPTEGTGSAGSLKATQAHLEDMRKLVFDYLNK